ncbi:MAG: VWA domain-containing protein [Bacteroidales bacterium]|nr:VWA domain-containing protein [Bacteroidales bacterium]
MKRIIRIASALTAISAILSCSAYDGYLLSPMEMPDGMYQMDANGRIQEPEIPGDNFDKIVENEFIKVADQPVSTFSIDADGASYSYMRRCIGSGFLPPANSVRTEEYLNYFTFDYPEPEAGETVGINAEIGVCPWNTEHMLLRLGLKGKSVAEADMPVANYILLVDTSGSMSGTDRIDLLKSGLCNMVDYMRPTDRIAIITYAGEVKRVLESTLVKDADTIKKAIRKLEASGYTPGGAAMKLAYDEAVEHYIKGGNNRIIMCTDGDFNVGVTSTDELVEMVESYLDKGIYLSIMGFGTGNYQDSKMESLSNHGNGTYTYIDSEEEMMKVFVHERSRFYSVANDTKCQVKFFDWVDSYRLIGYENRVMNNEDFNDDKKDAGEIGAGQTITALYELIPAADMTQNATAASFDVRYKKALGEESRLLHLEIGKYYEGVTKTGPEFNFAAGLAAYAMILRGSKFKGSADYAMVKELVGSASAPTDGVDPLKLRPGMLKLVEKAEQIQ